MGTSPSQATSLPPLSLFAAKFGYLPPSLTRWSPFWMAPKQYEKMFTRCKEIDEKYAFWTKMLSCTIHSLGDRKRTVWFKFCNEEYPWQLSTQMFSYSLEVLEQTWKRLVYIIQRCRVQLWINQDVLFLDEKVNFRPETTSPDLSIIARDKHRSIIC